MKLRRSVSTRAAQRVRHHLVHALVFVVALAVALVMAPPAVAAPAAAAPAAADDGILRVSIFYKTNFHASQAQARPVVRQLAQELATESGQELQIQETDNPAEVFTPENLATVDTLVFIQTGGVLFNTAQRSALEAYIRGGGGFAGMHYTGWSVGQSEHDVNPFYLRLVGAMSEGHPENPAVRPGRIVVKDAAHPLVEGLPAELTRSDEWYDWTLNPAPFVKTLVEADELSYGMGRQGTTHPITWCQKIDSGRSWYTGMGHEGTAYSEEFIQTQLKHGIAYGAGLVEADCTPPVKGEQGSWSGVTPWPVMPINVALTSDGQLQSFGSKGGQHNAAAYDFTGADGIYQGGQVEIDIWDPAQPRSMSMTREELRSGIIENATYTDLFCSMQVQNPHNHKIMTVGGDDGLGENAPNDGAMGVTSYDTNNGLQNEAPMNFARWYPTGTTMSDGSIVVQGGTLRGGPGGPGVLTPEIYTPDEGASWKKLTGARSAVAYGDGGNGQPDENRWWYPRAFVAPGSGNLYNITGTQTFELDPNANDGTGSVTDRGRLPAGIANQGALGNPVGATSTATMYRPGKILQVGGGWWANGGGPDGARAGFTVDLTTAGGTAAPVITATEPMKYQRHWATSTVMPDGNVIVTGGSRANAANGGYVTNAEIWNPDTGRWTTVEVPYEHARLYHSTAILLPDGRIMIGGGGAPGPRNYTDVEYYSPAYLFDGNEPAVRPQITQAPKKIGYNGTFNIAANGPVSRVTLVRNGSVTHSFNNDQNFQDLQFTAGTGGNITVTAPQDGTYAPPGAYMIFVFDADGTPSVATMLDINPAVKMDQRTPKVVEQFEYPRYPGNANAIVDVAPGNGRMAPWSVDSQVQLVPGQQPSQGALGATGYHLALGAEGNLSRNIQGLDKGRDYRIHLRYARDSRSAAGAGAANAQLSIGSLDTTLTAGTDLPSQGNGQDVAFGTYVGSFTASARSQVLRLAAGEGEAGMMIDNLVITAEDPGVDDVPVHYEFDEGAGTTSANTGTDQSVGAAQLTGATGWSESGVHDGAVNLPGGTNANAVDLPDNLLQGATDFATSFWARPDTKGNWIGMLHIGDGLGNAGSFFQIQMQTQAQGNTGLAATFKKKGSATQERVYAVPTRDVAANQWSHVVFTRQGATGTLYLNGQQIATKNNLTITMTDVGPTTNNWLGRNGFPDPGYDGLFDDVRLYETTLTAEDVAALYADGTAVRTTTTVSADPASPSPFGEPITFSATVAGAPGVAVQGEAELWVDGSRVGSPVEVVAGEATFPEVTLARGDHEVEVRFLADEGWRDSSAVTQHTVSRPPPGSGVPIHYKFEEGQGTSAANSGNDPSVGAATLQGATTWAQPGKCGTGINLPGGGAATGNQVTLPNNIQAGMTDEFSVAVWANPRALPNWVPLLQIGSSTDTFFLLQSSTQAAGATGFAATFKQAGNPGQERLTLGAGRDLPLNRWTHVVYTHAGTTGRIYFDGVLMATRTDFTLDMGDVGVGGNTTANWIGGTSWPDPRFNGQVDEFQMYGYELTTEQITGLMTCPAVNAAPVGVADAYETAEDEVLTVEAPGVLGNDTDADSNPLTATGLTQPTDGEVTLAADGSFTYTPDAGFTGTDTFTYRASDGTATSAATTVTITVEADQSANEAPVGAADAYATTQGQVVTVDAPGVLGNDTDADGDDLTATGLTQPANGEVTLAADGSFTYTPDAGFTGTDPFTYKADDGTATSAATTVTITVEGPPPPVNTAPVAGDDAYDAIQGQSLELPAPGVLANDTDADDEMLTATSATQPAHGAVTLASDGSFVYTPDAGFTGTDSFTYTADDGRDASAPARVVITVKAAGNAMATTAVVGVARPITHGETGSVSVSVSPRSATGTVQLSRGGTLLATATVADGQATLALAEKVLPPGTYNLDLRYAGDAGHKASSSTVEVTVAPSAIVRSTSKTSAKVRPKKPSFRQNFTVVIGVRALMGQSPTPTGKVKVRVDGRLISAGELEDGRYVIKVKRNLKIGKHVLTVAYRGDADTLSSKKRVKFRVVR